MRSTIIISGMALVLATGCWAPTSGELAAADYGLRPSNELAQTMVRDWIGANLDEPDGAVLSFGPLQKGWFRVESLNTEIRYAWMLPTTINEKSSVGGYRGARAWEFFFRGPYLVGVGQPGKRLGSRGRSTIIAYHELKGVDDDTGEPIDTSQGPVAPVADGEADDETDDEPAEVSRPSLSMELFERLVLGISYDDVTEVIGWPGEVLSDSIIGTQRITMVVWKSEDGRLQINCLFYDMALRQRGQRGLDD